jgi:hypothetical protein
MGNATVVAGLTAQGGGPDPAGQVRWPVGTSVAWPRGGGFPPRGLAAGELAAWRRPVQAAAAGR